MMLVPLNRPNYKTLPINRTPFAHWKSPRIFFVKETRELRKKDLNHCKNSKNPGNYKHKVPKILTLTPYIQTPFFLKCYWLKPSMQLLIHTLEATLTSVFLFPYTLHSLPPQRSQNITPWLFQKLQTSILLSTWRSCSEHYQRSKPDSSSQNIFQLQGKFHADSHHTD